ncbi:MAG: hypothetical protein HOI66_12915 [Verrucomicrobia bacterium]|jgi:hypothetical protein|nr:hypothetical protein [Verrucomicrobiota bacterium]
MKLSTFSVRDCYAALGIAAFLFLTAWGNALAMLLFSAIALVILLYTLVIKR